MKKMTGFAALLCLNSFIVQPAFAQAEETAMVPLPSQDDFSKGEDGWKLRPRING